MLPIFKRPKAARLLRHPVLALVLWLILPAEGHATQSTADIAGICERVATMAAQQTGVPVAVLRAISLNETGRKHEGAFRPWPWTVNMEGKGLWFDTEDEARAYVYKEYKRGARSFDVGCFQINFKWHGEAFRSIDEMFDPLANALYAARFLASLFQETGNWGAAAGAYHSRTPEFANRYQARFERLLAGVTGKEAAPIPEIPDIVLVANGGTLGPASADPADYAERQNNFPLLQTGAPTGLGSLVPIGNGNGASLFPAPDLRMVSN